MRQFIIFHTAPSGGTKGFIQLFFTYAMVLPKLVNRRWCVKSAHFPILILICFLFFLSHTFTLLVILPIDTKRLHSPCYLLRSGDTELVKMLLGTWKNHELLNNHRNFKQITWCDSLHTDLFYQHCCVCIQVSYARDNNSRLLPNKVSCNL